MEIAVSMEALDKDGVDTGDAVQLERRTLADRRLVEIVSPAGDRFWVDAYDLIKAAELLR